MKAEWFANVNGQEYGPYTWQQMLQMAAEGRVPPDLPVKRSIDKKWFAARQVPGLVTAAATDAKPAAKAATPRPAAKDDSKLLRAKPLAPSTAAGAVPVPPPPPPAAPPLAPAAAAASDSPWPVIVADGPKGKAAAPAGQPAASVTHKKKSPWLMIGILASAAAVVLLAGGIGVWAVWFRPPPTIDATSVADAPAPEANADESGDLVTIKTTASRQSARDEESRTAPLGPTKTELAEQEKLVKSITNWQSIAGVKSFGFTNVSLQVTRVWRADPPASDDEKGAGPYVCVEVTIRNKSPSPLRYKGWNSYGETGAVLASEDSELLPLVPVEKTPEISRLKQTSVPGSGSVQEVLVFQAPASEDEVLHLVLPYAAFYSNVRPPHRAIELTPDLMGLDLAQGGAAAAVPSDPLLTEAPAAEKTASADAEAPKATGKAKEPAKAPSLRDMINSETGPPARPDDMPAEKGQEPPASKEKMDKSEKGSPKGAKPAAKKPENPFEPKDE